MESMEERPHKAVLFQQASGMSEDDGWISVQWSDIDRVVVGRWPRWTSHRWMFVSEAK